MKIGVSSSCFYPLLTELSFEELGKNDVDTAEIFFNATSELSPEFIKKLKDIKDRYGITLTSVHPTMSLAESFVFFSSYERRYYEGLDSLRRYAEILNEMGGKYIIMHGGKPNKVLDNEGYFERFGKLSEEMRKCGVTLLQENVVKFRAGNLDVLKSMAEYLGDYAAFCLDIKQSIRGGYSPFDAVKALGDKVKHIHISDNTKEKDCLLPLTGTFDFDNFFDTAIKSGFKGDAIIEVYSDCYKDKSEIFDSFYKMKKKFSNLR